VAPKVVETRIAVREPENGRIAFFWYDCEMGAEVEGELAALIRGKRLDDAATRALESYGPELYGFLVSHLGNEPDAAEVFSQVGEDLWTGLPSFALGCSVRTWLYVLARHAAARFRRSPWNQRTGDSHLDALVERVRTRTQPWLRTDVKDRFAALRDALDPDDRSLLVLRVDRALSWEEIARVTLGLEAPDAAALEREANRLRKRYQLLKDELRKRAREAGLVGEQP
jgi:RNA polymerase sigma-70 factor (ECF subfamily)